LKAALLFTRRQYYNCLERLAVATEKMPCDGQTPHCQTQHCQIPESTGEPRHAGAGIWSCQSTILPTLLSSEGSSSRVHSMTTTDLHRPQTTLVNGMSPDALSGFFDFFDLFKESTLCRDLDSCHRSFPDAHNHEPVLSSFW
jgi:hypothetical protein